jgi:hypothetical protein
MTKAERDELRAAEAKMTRGKLSVIGDNVPGVFSRSRFLPTLKEPEGLTVATVGTNDIQRTEEYGEQIVFDARGIALIRNRIVALLDHADEAERVLTAVLDSSADLIDFLDTEKTGCGEAIAMWASATADAEKFLEGKP